MVGESRQLVREDMLKNDPVVGCYPMIDAVLLQFSLASCNVVLDFRKIDLPVLTIRN